MDCKLNFDENSSYRQPDIFQLRDWSQTDDVLFIISVFCMDCKLNFDENSSYRQPDRFQLRDWSQTDVVIPTLF